MVVEIGVADGRLALCDHGVAVVDVVHVDGRPRGHVAHHH